MLSMAFRPQSQIYDPSIIWVPKTLTLENIRKAWEIIDYPKAFVISLRLNIISSILQVITCSFAGYGFASFQFKFKKIFFSIVLFTMLIPSQIISIPTFMQFKNFDFFGIGSLIGLFTGTKLVCNLIDSSLTFYLPAVLGAGIKSGLFIFIFRQFFKGMPNELGDAAAIDGCGFFSCYIRIVVPNSLVVFIMATLLSSVWYWNDYFTASIYMRNVQTISTALANLSSVLSGGGTDAYQIVTTMQAGCLLSIFPILIMFILLQRFFVQGVERAGIVG